MIDFDTMLIHVGEFGLYQKILFLVQAPFCFFVTWLLFGQVFIFLYPRVYWCEDRCLNFTGLTREQSRNLSVPFINGAFDPCRTYNVSEDDILNLVSDTIASCPNTCQNRAIPCEFNAVGGDCRPLAASNSATGRSKRQTTYLSGGGGARWSRPGPGQGQYSPGPNWPGGFGYNPARPTAPGPVFPQSSSSTDKTIDTAPPVQSQPQRPSRPQTESATTNNPVLADRRPTEDTAIGSRRPTPSSGSRSQTNCVGVSGRTTSIPATPGRQKRSCAAGSSTGSRCISNLPNNTLINGQNLTSNWNRRLRNCESWAYDPPDLRYPTIVSEMGWWCDPETWITIASAIFFLGAIVGGIGIGYIADSRGRLPALVAANILGCIGGTLSAVFYQNYVVFCIFRFICGMGFDNCFTMIYVLVLEYVGPTYRTVAANLSIAIFYTMGTLVLPWLALAIGDWRYYTMAISLPMLFAIAVIFVVPESARWLISQGRIEEATKILRSFAKVNKKNVDEAIFLEFEETATQVYEEARKEKKVTFLDAMKKPRIAKNFILLALIWSMIALVYNGHSRNILNLGDDVFILFTVASSTEFPADMLLIFTLDRFGRRWLAFLSLTLSGAFSLASAMVPIELTTAALVMALLSRFWVNVALNIGLQYAAELLPTVIRAQGVNTIHIMGNVASIVSPFISSLGRTNPVLAGLILGVAAITGGVLSLFLPESLGEDLPNTLEDGETFGKDQSFWNCPICAKPKPVEEPSEEQSRVQLRNRMRASLRGETYRSSIISGTSKRSTPSSFEAIHLLPSGAAAAGPSGQGHHRYTQ